MIVFYLFTISPYLFYLFTSSYYSIFSILKPTNIIEIQLMFSTFYSAHRHEQELAHFDTNIDQVLGKQFTPNAHTSSKHHRRNLILDQVLCTIIIVQMILINLYFQIDVIEGYSAPWLILSALVGLISIVILTLRYSIRNQYLAKMQQEQQSLTLFLFSIFTLLVMPYPFLQNATVNFTTKDNKQIAFKVNYLLAAVSSLRFLPMAAAILTKSKYLTPRAYRLGKMNSVQPDLLSALRGYYKNNPLSFIGMVFLVSVILVSFSLRIAQCKNMPSDLYVVYSNVIWMTAMTMTTVGFGDISPVTPVGKIVAVICAVWGVLIFSVMVGVLTQILALNNKEAQSVLILKKLKSKEQLKQKAGIYLRTSLWRLWQNHKYKLSKRQSLSELKLRRQFSYIRNKKDYQSKQDMSLNLVTQIDREFNHLLIELQYLVKNNSKIIDHLNEQIMLKQGLKVRPLSGTSLSSIAKM